MTWVGHRGSYQIGAGEWSVISQRKAIHSHMTLVGQTGCITFRLGDGWSYHTGRS